MSHARKKSLSILICTARRPDFLRDLLNALRSAHEFGAAFDLEVIVVDNDPKQSAKPVFDQLSPRFGAPLRYEHEAEPGVSSARNKALALATHSLCLFLDDDQMVSPKFLNQLSETLSEMPADAAAVRLHVAWQFEVDIPIWLQRGLSDDADMHGPKERHGKQLFRTEMGTGGLLLNKEHIIDGKRNSEPLFDVTLNGIGGEDVAMFLKASAQGKKFYFAAYPAVTERVPRERATIGYGLRSAHRKGYVDATLALRQGKALDRFSYTLKTLIQTALACVLLALSSLGGQLRAFNGALTLWRQLGKCAAIWQRDFRFYTYINQTPIVLHLTGGGHDGGAEKIIEQISVHTPPHTASLRFFFYDSNGPRSFSTVISQRWDSIVHHKKSQSIDWKLWLRLARFVRQQKITVIHTHDIGAMLHANVARILNPGVRLVHTEHTLHYWINRQKYRALYYVLSLSYDSIACVSAYVKDEVHAKIGVAKKKLKIVPNGVDVDAFRPLTAQDGPARVERHRLSLISVSRIDDNKNVAQILRAIASVRRRGLNVTLTHVGSGQKEDVEKILTLSKELRLSESVTFAGFQSQVAPWIASADCFISASKVECHPVSVLEAMASGKPCILSGIAPHREVQNATSNPGIILFGEQDEALADAIENMYENFNTHKRSAYELIESTRNSYSIPVMLARYSTLYAGI